MDERNQVALFSAGQGCAVGDASASVGPCSEQGVGGGQSAEGAGLADIVAICEHMCPLGPLVMAAAGKPPSFSPQKIVEHIRWHAQSIPDDEYLAVKGLPKEWTPQSIRSTITRQAELADGYVLEAPLEVVGALAVNAEATPVEVTAEGLASAIFLRKATNEPDVMPQPAEFGTTPWHES
jgi:hypothetical protein